MRTALLLLHRWAGLAIAAFLIVSGITGAVISWDHELDEWLNPQLYRAEWAGLPQSSLALADRIESEHPGLVVTYLPLAVEPGHALVMSVDADRSAAGGGRTDPTFNQVAVNPGDGAVQARRMWGEPALTRENLLPFLYKLHYSMHIPDMAGMEVGVLFMGVIGILWVLDAFVALWLSFPAPRAWRKSFALRWRQGGYRRLFDLHRSGGVWTWLIVLVVAVTSVSMNLGTEVVRPLVNSISPLSPSPFDAREAAGVNQARVSREAVLGAARAAAAERGIVAPAGGLFYSPDSGVYGVGFFAPGRDHGDGGLGNPWLYFDAATGRPAGADIPGTGSAGDLFMQAQFPLHSGRIAGVPGRVLVSVLGLVVAGLSITGVMIWARKRAARRVKLTRDASDAAPAYSRVV